MDLNNLTDYLDTAGDAAGTILGALNPPPTQQTTITPTATQQLVTPQTNWNLIMGIGAAVLGVLVLVIVFARKK